MLEILETHGVYVREWWAEKIAELPIDKEKLTWGSMLSHWDAIETDFHRTYGVDFETDILQHRTWRWFQIRTVRLLTLDSGLAQALGINNTPPIPYF